MEEAEAGSGKILKEVEAFWQNKLEAEASLEATNFIRSWKWKQKSQEWRSGSKLGSMTLQEELEGETKNFLLLLHLCSKHWLLHRICLKIPEIVQIVIKCYFSLNPHCDNIIITKFNMIALKCSLLAVLLFLLKSLGRSKTILVLYINRTEKLEVLTQTLVLKVLKMLSKLYAFPHYCVSKLN